MQADRKVLEVHRVNRREMVQAYAGTHWSNEGKAVKQPLNLIAQYVQTILRDLVPANPRVMLSTFSQAAKPVASAMQSWMNQQIQDIDLESTLQKLALDALFGIGIAKVALATPPEASNAAWNLDAGEAGVFAIDLDDFVAGPLTVPDPSQFSYIGHRFRAPLEVVKKSGMYLGDKKKLGHTEYQEYNEEGDERISNLLHGWVAEREEFEDWVDLWEIYLPRKRLVVTLVDENTTGSNVPLDKALSYQHWVGPSHGPYVFLSFADVPGSPIGKAPIQDLITLHDDINQLYRKSIRQAENQKRNYVVQSSEDGESLAKSMDQQWVRTDNPAAVQMVDTGGPDQTNLGFAMHLSDRFNELSGNLALLAGLGAQSPTARQDAMLNENASRTIRDMQERMIRFTGKICRALGWFWHHDPFKTMNTTYQSQAMPEMELNRTVEPMQRMVIPWEQLQLKVDPYSMQPKTPQGRFRNVVEIITQLYMPLMQLAMQQGIVLDLKMLFRMAAEMLDEPDLNKLLTITEPMEVQGPSHAAGGSGTKTSYNVRESLPGRTQKGDNMNFLNALRGVNPGGNGQTKTGGY